MKQCDLCGDMHERLIKLNCTVFNFVELEFQDGVLYKPTEICKPCICTLRNSVLSTAEALYDKRKNI